MEKEDLLKKIEKGLIVSCQALENEPMYSPKGGIMPRFALAAKMAGAVGIRANSVRDIREIKDMVDLPTIGIIKKEYEGYEAYITPSMAEVDALVEIGCDVIATDFTNKTRIDSNSAFDFVRKVKDKYPDQILMADCASLKNAIDAEKAGVDLIGTTMNGYTSDTEITDGPNLDLIRDIKKNCKTPVVAEGRIHYPNQAREVLEAGAFCLVVGGAITRPMEIAARFIEAIKDI